MQIRLKDTIHPELKSLLLKEGDIIEGRLVNKKTGLVHFEAGGENCSIWKEDYELIQNNDKPRAKESRPSRATALVGDFNISGLGCDYREQSD